MLQLQGLPTGMIEKRAQVENALKLVQADRQDLVFCSGNASRSSRLAFRALLFLFLHWFRGSRR